MSSFVLSSHRPCDRGVTAGVLYSGLVSLGFLSLQGEWSAVTGRPVLIALDIVVGALGLGALLLVRRAPVGLALVLSALLTVSAALTPVAGTAMLWVGRRYRLPIAIGVATAGVAGHVVRQLWRPEPDRPLLLWLTVVAASYVVLVAWGTLNRTGDRRAQVQASVT